LEVVVSAQLIDVLFREADLERRIFIPRAIPAAARALIAVVSSIVVFVCLFLLEELGVSSYVAVVFSLACGLATTTGALLLFGRDFLAQQQL